jgi:small subunit ribosomal protein S7
MSRRRSAPQRTILPDPKYNDKTLAKFMNIVMVDGKKSIAEKIVYNALDIMFKKADKSLINKASSGDGDGDGDGGDGSVAIKPISGTASVIDLFNQILHNVSPILEVKSRRVGGATYQVPMEVRPKRRQALAMRWIVDSATKRNEKTMEDRLAHEFIDALENRGSAIKKKDETHRMAEANKAFAHFRF